MGVRKKTEWSEERIQNMLRLRFLSNSSKKYEIFNSFIYGWESDYFVLTKSGYAYECEIKISRSDFKNEAKHKEQKYLILEGKYEPKFPSWLKEPPKYNINENRPNYFYYAVPEGLIEAEEIPENCGLIYVTYGGIQIVKKAPKLHDEKVNIERLKLIDKFYYSMWNWRDKYVSNDIKSLKEQIKGLEKTINVYDEELSIANCKIDEMASKLKKYEENDII